MLERPLTEQVEASVNRVLPAGEAEIPDDVLSKVEDDLKGLPRETVKSALISLVNQGILELTWEGRLKRSK